MTQAKHTAGEWFASPLEMSKRDWAALNSGAGESLQSVRRGADVIAVVWCGDDEDGEEAANARLIAEAPRMLEAAQDLVDFLGDGPADDGSADAKIERARIAALRAIISKATGASK